MADCVSTLVRWSPAGACGMCESNVKESGSVRRGRGWRREREGQKEEREDITTCQVASIV